MYEKSNKAWLVSGFSTAVGVIVEWNPFDGYDSSAQSFSGKLREYKLRGFSVSGSTAVAISTLVISLRHGKSSDAPLTTLALCKEPGAGQQGITELEGINAGYFALYTSVAHADGGLVGMIWGD